MTSPLVNPLYSWIITKPFYTIFTGVTTTVSFFSNFLLLFIIHTTQSEHIGTYRYLLAYFSLCDIAATIAHLTVQPVIHMATDGDKQPLYFFPRTKGREIFGVSTGTVSIVLFIAMYFQTFLVLAFHFVYRYKAVTSGLTKSFTDSWTVMHWFLAGFILNLFYFTSFVVGVGVGLTPTQEDRRTMPAEILEIYGVDLRDPLNGCLQVKFSEVDRVTNETHANLWAIGVGTWGVSLFALTAIAIVVCISKTTAALKAINLQMTAVRKRMHHQLFHALLMQTAIPILFSYVPLSLIIFTGFVNGLSIFAFGNVLFMITAIFPAIDGFFVLFFIVKFRHAVIRLFKIPVSSVASSVERIGSK